MVDRINISKYPSVKKHLDKFYSQLEKREDQGDTPYNLRSCAYMDDFNNQKICWPDISTTAAFVRINEPFYVSNTAYILSNGPDWLACYLNSAIANWYIKTTSSSLGDSGTRFIKQFIVKLPIPNKYSNNDKEVFNLTDDELNYLLKNSI